MGLYHSKWKWPKNFFYKVESDLKLFLNYFCGNCVFYCLFNIIFRFKKFTAKLNFSLFKKRSIKTGKYILSIQGNSHHEEYLRSWRNFLTGFHTAGIRYSLYLHPLFQTARNPENQENRAWATSWGQPTNFYKLRPIGGAFRSEEVHKARNQDRCPNGTEIAVFSDRIFEKSFSDSNFDEERKLETGKFRTEVGR